MASRKLSNHVASGNVTGTGALLSVLCGFSPKAVFICNTTGKVRAEWDDCMPSAAMVKIVDVPAGTVAMTNHADSAGTPAQATGASNAASAVASKLNLGAPSFSGTGFVTGGQVITTSDNQTMPAVDSAAGMWFIANGLAASPPVLILSNTIVAGAPAVLTCQGVPPVTDAGTYKIVSDVGSAAAQAVTQASYSALGTHSHANTAAFTGSASGMSYAVANGITPMFNGFKIGADADLNVIAEELFWVAIK